MLSEVFWIAFISSMTALCLGIARMAYKSKCKEVTCFCCKIVRDVEIEERELEFVSKLKDTTENI